MQQTERQPSSGFQKFIDECFLDHPRMTGESYVGHLLFTLKNGLYLILIAFVLIFHGLVPRFCATTASKRLFGLCDVLKARWDKCQDKK